MNARTHGFVAILTIVAALGSSVSCKDHAYRHDVEGQVIDEKGAAIAGAVVTRVNDKGEPYGIPDLYQRKADETGHFRFESDGRGPPPVATQPWRLAVEVPTRKDRAHFDVNAVWSDDRKTCFGYCAKGLSLVVK